jgi:hypothetical protein
MQIDWCNLKTVLMPRQHFLKLPDLSGKRNVPQLLEMPRLLASDYKRLVFKNVVLLGMDIKEALNIYLYPHLISYKIFWRKK